jgi:hypothetical protein
LLPHFDALMAAVLEKYSVCLVPEGGKVAPE